TPGHPKPYKIGRTWYQPLPHARGFKQRGIASWYGKKFHGRKTSNGETYNMFAMTAAHKTLPFNTHIKVHNLENGKEVKVRINDRGPFIRGRIIDLSHTAAKKIGMLGSGTAHVEIAALGVPSKTRDSDSYRHTYKQVDYYKGNFTIQVGAFSDRKNAERLKRKLGRSYKNSHITTHNDGYSTYYRVRVGKCSTLEQAVKYEEIMIKRGFLDAFAVAEDN
ncbi:MAG: septal ring lytic transglycosylase RlpA family protein, partial [Deltaproteobacteria bacterium]|nr:septal ring lytic transglycosylase RlpA family protein [Deltaproteobacteria bacterium]